MIPSVVSALLALFVSLFRSRRAMYLQILALQHQLAVYKHTVARPRLRPTDRMVWAWLARLWPDWQAALVFVQPRTVITWQRQRFRDHWRRLSQQGKPGLPAIVKEMRELIQDMWKSNPTWGSPRIVGELRKPDMHVAKSTVEKYRPKIRKPSSPTWKALLNNHITDIVACDFCTVPTATFQVLFVFILLAHERRRIVHYNVTAHPTTQWTAQQVIEAFPWDEAPRYLLRDRDRIYGEHFQQRVAYRGIEEVKTAPRSPWQNPYCERVIGSIRRDVLDQVIVLNERHLMRLLTAYFSYDHRFRTHLALDMDCPVARAVEPPECGHVRAVPEVGGLHHHYERSAA